MLAKRRTKITIRTKVVLAACWLLFLLAVVTIGVYANDGKPARIIVKGEAPVNYYQAFMIAVAAGYGIYLLIRFRRKKRNEEL